MKQIMDTDPDDTFFRFRIDSDLLRRVKSMAALKGTTIKQIITWLLKQEVERFERGMK